MLKCSKDLPDRRGTLAGEQSGMKQKNDLFD